MISRAEKEYAEVLKRSGLVHDHWPPAVKLPGGLWSIDYLVTDPDGTQYYVEVKCGLMCENFRLKLELYRLTQERDGLLPLFVVKRVAKEWFRVIDEIGTSPITEVVCVVR